MVTLFFLFPAIAVIIVAMMLRAYFNQAIPQGLPAKQHHRLRMFGLVFKAGGIMAYTLSRLGIGDLINNIRYIHDLMGHLRTVPEEPSLHIEDTTIADIPVRVYSQKKMPCDGSKLTGVVFLHGGGWMFGSIDLYHQFSQNLAKSAGVVVVSVGYRLAPEHPFPAGFDDCYAVVKTLLETGANYGIDTERIVVAGYSAGGNLAAAVTLHLCNENIKIPAAQILVYPALQFMDFSLPSYENNSSPALSRKDMMVMWSVYLTGTRNVYPSFRANNHSLHLHSTRYSKYVGNHKHMDESKTVKQPSIEIPQSVCEALTDYRVAPLMANDLTGLPSTLIITGKFDVLRDDGVLFKKRLQEAGVNVIHYEYETYHGFFMLKSNREICDAANENVSMFLKGL